MKKLILFLFTITFFTSFSQTEDAWLFLKDKPNKTSYLNNPLTMLSQRALDRRANLNISLDSLDVPIDENYYNLLKKESKITILGKSKWLNAVHIQGEVDDIQNLITSYSFIKNIEFANKSLNTLGKSSSTSISNSFGLSTHLANSNLGQDELPLLVSSNAALPPSSFKFFKHGNLAASSCSWFK